MPYRSWQFRIDDIIEAINKIERLSESMGNDSISYISYHILY